MNKENSPTENSAAGFPLETVVIRFLFLFTHLYLAAVHFFVVEEGRQFFRDEAAGRRKRLKRNKVERLFPNLRKEV